MWKNIPLKTSVYISFGLNAVTVTGIIAAKSFLPPVVPLFYGLPAGVSQLITTLGLLIAPTVSLGITLVNIFLTTFTKDHFLKKALIVSSTFVSILVSITIAKIIFLVAFF